MAQKHILGKSEVKTIATLRPKHMLMAEWLIANPDATLTDLARQFGYSRTWVAVVYNSEVFQEYLRGKIDAIYEPEIYSLRDKLLGLAHVAVEKLSEAVEEASPKDRAFLLDSVDRLLHRLGYAPTKGPDAAAVVANTQNNVYVVDRETLDDARRRYLAAVGVPSLPGPQDAALANKDRLVGAG